MNAVTPVAVRATDPYRVEARAVADELSTDLERGLSAAEAARRLAADGPNALLSAAPVPQWRKFHWRHTVHHMKQVRDRRT